MKKASVFAAAAITIAAASAMMQPASAYEWQNIHITDDALFDALKHAEFDVGSGGSVTLLDKGTIYMGTPFETGVVQYTGSIERITFDCSNGDPLAGVTDFSSLASFEEAITLRVCEEGYESKVPANITIAPFCSFTVNFVTSDDEIIKQTVTRGYCEDYTTDTPHGIETLPLSNYRLVSGSYAGDPAPFVFAYGDQSESVQVTIKADNAAEDVYASYFSEYYDILPVATWNDQSDKTITFVYDRIVRDVPAGNYNVPLDDYNENGELSKLRDENGNETDYIVADIIAILDTLEEGDITELIVNDNYAFIAFNTANGAITVTIGEKPAETEPVAEETEPETADNTENPNTIDSLSAILITTVASATILGFGIASKTRRR